MDTGFKKQNRVFGKSRVRVFSFHPYKGSIVDSTVIKRLEEIVGTENVSTELIDLVAHSTDAGEYRARPDVVVIAHTTQEISDILKMANELEVPVIPRGAGTNTSGQTIASKGGIMLDLHRMDQILEVSLEDRVAVVQPGVVYANLNKVLEPMGFCYPPDPASGKVATLGGNIATNAGGLKGAKYGVTKDYVLGLEVVLPTGEIMRTGTRTIKSSSGFNLTQLFVGSEGALGVITEATLKIAPKPTELLTAMATFDKLVDAGKAVSEIMRSGCAPTVLELLDKHLIRAINQNTELGLPQVEAILLTETDGYTQAEAEFQLGRITDIFKSNGASSVRRAKDRDEAEALWTARRSAYAVIARLNNSLLSEDTTVPLSKVPDMLAIFEEIGKKYDLMIPTVGHVADGNLHPHFSFDRLDKDQVERVEKAKDELYERAVELGGTLSGEHGIGLAKAKYMKYEHDAMAMRSMRNLKKLFDPKGILNPGKQDLES